MAVCARLARGSRRASRHISEPGFGQADKGVEGASLRAPGPASQSGFFGKLVCQRLQRRQHLFSVGQRPSG